MAKITVSRIFEISRYLTTKSGKELEDALRYISSFSELTLRVLRNQLTFGDNLDCEIKTVSLRSSVPAIISTTVKRRAVRITVDQAIDQVYYLVDSFGWKYDTNGNIVVCAKFADTASTAPAADVDIILSLVIHFG